MHCTPEQLALAALGEPLPAPDERHLEDCPACRAEVGSLRRPVDALAVPELAATGPGVTPPPAVWTAVAAATGVATAPRLESPSARETVPAAREAVSPGRRARRDRASRPDGSPRPDRPRRPGSGPRRRLLLAASAAVVGAAVALGAVALAHGPAASRVAEAQLRSLPGSAASGSAVVVERADHTLDLQVTLRGREPASGYYEAWLADAGLDRMVAVGALHDGTTTLPLPAGLSLDRYSVVDVSVQQLNGEPAHSDHSVARGLLG